MIALVFLVSLLAVLSFAAATGAAALPIYEILMLIGVFLIFFSSGVYIGAVLGVLSFLIGFWFSDRPWWSFAGQTLTPSLVVNTQQFFTAVVTVGGVTLTPGLFTNSQVFYAHQITGGLVITPKADRIFTVPSERRIFTVASERRIFHS
jgi:hypothetical protein